MPDLLQELKEKKKQIEGLQRQRARQEGQKEQLLKRLKEEFGISAEDVEKTLETLSKELVQNEKILNQYRNEMDNILSGIHSKNSARKSEEE